MKQKKVTKVKTAVSIDIAVYEWLENQRKKYNTPKSYWVNEALKSLIKIKENNKKV